MGVRFNNTIKYFAGITNDSMILWSLGYMTGVIIGFLASPLWVLIITLSLTVGFLLTKAYAERIYGRRVNVTLPEELIVNLEKNKPTI